MLAAPPAPAALLLLALLLDAPPKENPPPPNDMLKGVQGFAVGVDVKVEKKTGECEKEDGLCDANHVVHVKAKKSDGNVC